jgi:hypothetical protein
MTSNLESRTKMSLERGSGDGALPPLTIDHTNAHALASWFFRYAVTLNVQEYQEGLQYWRGVESCSAVSIEATVEVATNKLFTEQITLVVSSAVRVCLSQLATLIAGLLAVFTLVR